MTEKRNGKMTQNYCLLHSVQCWAQLDCYCRKLSCTCASIFSLTSGLSLLLEQVQ